MVTESDRYVRPESLDHALQVLSDHPDAEILAAGQSLLPKLRAQERVPEMVVDIGALGAMRGVECTVDTANVGSLATYTTVHETSELRDRAGTLTEAVGKSADHQVRNAATIGGNLVTPYPVSDLSAAVVASDATLVVRNRDSERRVESEAALASSRSSLNDDELLTRIVVPLPEADVGSVYYKQSSPTSRYTLVGVAAHIEVEDQAVAAARVAATGVYDRVTRLDHVDSALVGEAVDDVPIAAIANRASTPLDTSRLVDDAEASAAYRAQLLDVCTERALEHAIEAAVS